MGTVKFRLPYCCEWEDDNKECTSSQEPVAPRPECGWYVEDKQIWDSGTGCKASKIEGSNDVWCECTHTTDYAVLLFEKANNCEEEHYTAVYYVFAPFYALLGGYASFVFAGMTRPTKRERALGKCVKWPDVLGRQHGLIAVAVWFRFLGCLSLAQAFELPLVVQTLLLSIPYMVEAFVFSRLAMHWATIGKSTTDLTVDWNKKLQPVLIAVNVFIAVACISNFVTFGVITDTATIAQVGTIGTSVLVVLNIVLTILFVVSSKMMLNALEGVIDNKRKVKGSTGGTKMNFVEKTRIVGLFVVPACFLLQAVFSATATTLHLQSTETIHQTTLTTMIALFHSFDLLSLMAIVFLYFSSVYKKLFTPKNSASAYSSNAKVTPPNSNAKLTSSLTSSTTKSLCSTASVRRQTEEEEKGLCSPAANPASVQRQMEEQKATPSSVQRQREEERVESVSVSIGTGSSRIEMKEL